MTISLTLIDKFAGLAQEDRREQNANLIAIQDLLNTLVASVNNTMVQMTNRTGAPTVKGYLAAVSADYDNAVQLTAIGGLNPMGVFLEDGVADGEETWIVVTGIAEVYFSGSTTRGHIARVGFSDDTGEVAGQALSEPYPTNPFATEKHFAEIGHVIQSRTGAGLARVILHFN